MIAALFFLLMAVCVAFPLSVAAFENIRVAVADNQQIVIVQSPAGLIDGSGKAKGIKKIAIKPSDVGNRVVRFASTNVFLQMNGRSYRGWIEIRRKENGRLLVINDLNIEEYLKGVVAAEIPHDWEPEVLKAQAIASRTYALYEKKMAGKRPYHILATVDSQVYEGKRGESPAAIKAVQQTEGVVITYDGQLIPAFYHSSCGGQTENAMELWGIEAPYLQGVDCECQRISKYGTWQKSVTTAQMTDSLGKLGYPLTHLVDVAVDGITQAGRVKRVAFRDESGQIFVPAEKMRAAIGYSAIPSVFFEIELSNNEIVISGRGMGHGVGLCQWGAREMAQRGLDYRSILTHYYPGTKLKKKETGKL